MTRTSRRTTEFAIATVMIAALAACSSAPAPQPAATPASVPSGRGVDTTFTGPQHMVAVPADQRTADLIVAEGMQRSHAGDDLAYLSDVIGPRLTATQALKRANDWTAGKFREYGLVNVHLEPWKFGQSWTRGPAAVRMTAPHERWLNAVSWAWAPGTNGAVNGDVVYMNATTRSDFDARFAGKLRGKWILPRGPVTIWNPDGPAMSRADSVRLDSLRRAQFAAPATPFRDSLVTVLANEGIAGYVASGAKQFGLETMSGSPARVYPFPYLVVDNETYGQMHRLLARGERVALEANMSNSIGADSVMVFNTVAEIRGSEKPDEVVLLGAHLDSWDLGTGTTDNGTGSIAVLEAARILQAAGVKPKRTIRFVLFTGEEQGLYGSKRYCERHKDELAKHSVSLVHDTGTGPVLGFGLQGREAVRKVLEPELDSLKSLAGWKGLDLGSLNGTDHQSFEAAGVPGFACRQDMGEYRLTHHTQSDTFDKASEPNLVQGASVIAVTALRIANLPDLLPRDKPPAPKRDRKE